MKKILFAICLFYPFSVCAKIDCEEAGGHRFQGASGAYYCRAIPDKIVAMNWWSANAWCQSLGWELVDLETECKKKTVSIVSPAVCPQLTLNVSITAWAKNTSSSSKALVIHTDRGELATSTKNGTLNAFCLVK